MDQGVGAEMTAASFIGDTSRVRVSVCVMTYNHEGLIARAIESVLAQQTPFRIELVIGEDCSTDATRRIVCDYQRRYPAVIRLLLNERNLGMHENFVRTYAACSGEYVALLEGDDYWTDRHKLQKQVAFLDAHADCAACFHNVEVRYERGERSAHPFHRTAVAPRLQLTDIVSDFHIPPLSLMFRSALIREFPRWYHAMPMGDWPLNIMLATHGDIAYHDEIMGVYWRHDGGIWTSMHRRDNILTSVRGIDIVRRNLASTYRPYLNRLKSLLLLEAMEISLTERKLLRGVIDGARSYLALRASGSRSPFPPRHLVKRLRKGLGRARRIKPGIAGESRP